MLRKVNKLFPTMRATFLGVVVVGLITEALTGRKGEENSMLKHRRIAKKGDDTCQSKLRVIQAREGNK